MSQSLGCCSRCFIVLAGLLDLSAYGECYTVSERKVNIRNGPVNGLADIQTINKLKINDHASGNPTLWSIFKPAKTTRT